MPTLHIARGYQAISSAAAEPTVSWEDVQSLAASFKGEQVWGSNNQALKYFRYMGEEPCGVSNGTICWDLLLNENIGIGQMEHAKRGTGFSFDSPAVAGKMQVWYPAKFLAGMRPDTVKLLGLKEHGVKKLRCVCWVGTTDMMRVRAAEQEGNPFADFVTPLSGTLYSPVVTGLSSFSTPRTKATT